jgi:Protein of unknown function (DUF2867)
MRPPDRSSPPSRSRSLYPTDTEWAAELANRTVHSVLHMSWVPDGAGGYRGQMAVLIKPNGLFGKLYFAAIAPFRYLIVYPPLVRGIGQEWQAGMSMGQGVAQQQHASGPVAHEPDCRRPCVRTNVPIAPSSTSAAERPSRSPPAPRAPTPTCPSHDAHPAVQ